MSDENDRSHPDPRAEVQRLLDGNRRWAEEKRKQNPDTFPVLARRHEPPFMVVGCCDARMPMDLVTGTDTGELFLHRNVANQVRLDDPAMAASVEFAVGTLGIRHLIVTGHTACGGVKAALSDEAPPAVARWVEPVRRLADEVAGELTGAGSFGDRADLLAARNVIRQLENLLEMEPVRQALRDSGRILQLHGWLFHLETGLIEELDLPMDRWGREGRLP